MTWHRSTTLTKALTFFLQSLEIKIIDLAHQDLHNKLKASPAIQMRKYSLGQNHKFPVHYNGEMFIPTLSLFFSPLFFFNLCILLRTIKLFFLLTWNEGKNKTKFILFFLATVKKLQILRQWHKLLVENKICYYCQLDIEVHV